MRNLDLRTVRTVGSPNHVVLLQIVERENSML